MRKLISVVLVSAGLGFSAQAEGAWSGNLGVTSDYIFRGVSQTQNKPALQGGVDYSKGAFYAGGWTSMVDFGTDAVAEVDFYAGFAGQLDSGLTYDVNYGYYLYPGDEAFNVGEFKLSVGYAFASGASVGGTVFYDPENRNTTLEASAGAALIPDKLSASLAFGEARYDAGGDYRYASASLTYAFPVASVSLSVSSTDGGEDIFGEIAEPAVSLSLLKTF